MTSGIALLAALLVPTQLGVLGVGSEWPEATARLQVRTAVDCTSRADLIARVAVRSPRIRFVEDDETALVVRASFAAARSGGVVGELVLTESRGTILSRRLHAHSCADAADAIALIIAVTLDPASVNAGETTASEPTAAKPAAVPSTATTAPSSPPGSPVPPPTSMPSPGVVPAAKSPLQSTPTPVKPPVSAPPRSPAPSSSPAPLASRSDSSSSGSGVRSAAVYLAGQTVFGPAPSVMPGVGLYAMVGLDRGSLWSPAIMLGATHAGRGDLHEPGGTASFTLDAASLDACAVHVRSSFVEARACGSVLVGRLSASGSETSAEATVARPMVVTGVAVVLTSHLGAMVELALRLGAGASLVRDSYEFGDAVFHRAALMTSSASLGVGVRLP